MDMFSLKGKTAVVTGASKNIGAAISAGFAEAGANVVMMARTPGPLEKHANDVARKYGVKTLAVAGDVKVKADVQRLIQRTFETFPKVDILVNNAYDNANTWGLTSFDITDEHWDRCFKANVMGPWWLSMAFGKRMLEGSGGNIINLLSTSVYATFGPWTPYASTKAALGMMTRYLAKEWAPKVRLNCLVPGTINEDGTPRKNWDRLLPSIPMKRFGAAQDMVGAAIYLASGASAYTTGQVIFVDGGRITV